jgi:hypothetical protein
MGSHLASGGYKYRSLVLRDGGWAWGSQSYPVKQKIVEKPPRNSAGYFGGVQGLSWAVEPRKEGRAGLVSAPSPEEFIFIETSKVQTSGFGS